jgi:hypothetical protein
MPVAAIYLLPIRGTAHASLPPASGPTCQFQTVSISSGAGRAEHHPGSPEAAACHETCPGARPTSQHWLALRPRPSAWAGTPALPLSAGPGALPCQPAVSSTTTC